MRTLGWRSVDQDDSSSSSARSSRSSLLRREEGTEVLILPVQVRNSLGGRGPPAHAEQTLGDQPMQVYKGLQCRAALRAGPPCMR